MSLLTRHPKAVLALGIITLLVLVGIGSNGVKSGQTAPAEAAGNLATTSYFPILKISPPYPANSLDIEPFVTSLSTDTVTDIKHAGDSRLFIVEREGRIRIVLPNGTILPTPFLDISGPTVATANWEQGLLGLAFHPNYAANGFFYIFYTAAPSNNIRIMRYKVSANPDVANPLSGILLIEIPKPLDGEKQPSEVHNGGSMHFGMDGYLYISIGDGGPDPWIKSGQPGDPYNNSQRLNTMLGKVLRINVNGNDPDCGNAGYSIPPNNPYFGSLDDICDEIWASGFRNPWRMSMDRLTGDLYIGDVGEWLFEEINYQPAASAGGQNYGWHCYEGTTKYFHIYPEIAPHCPHPQSFYTFPIFEYPRTDPCTSAVGGYVYRGNEFPGIYGQYLFADFCTSRVWRTYNDNGVWDTVQVADFQLGGISTFGEDVAGEMYIGTFLPGRVYKIVP
jgi:glucose/arabinose dehydrogenase